MKLVFDTSFNTFIYFHLDGISANKYKLCKRLAWLIFAYRQMSHEFSNIDEEN